MARYEKLQKLIDLQEITTRRWSIEQELKGVPERKEDLENNLHASAEAVEGVQAELEAFRLEQQKDETALKEIEERLEAKRKQQSEVKTNTEFTAVKKEISALENNKDALENSILNWMDEITTREEQLKELEAQAAAAQQAHSEEIGPLQERLQQAQQQLAEIEEEAAELRQTMDRRWLETFDRLVVPKRGQVVVPIELEEGPGATGSCSGCHAHLPLAVSEAVRYGQQIAMCDSCSRVLFYPDDEADED